VSVNVIDFDTAKSTLISGQDAQDGLLTQSYSGTTKSGVAYEYHLLDANSAVPVAATSHEISVSDATTSAEFDGMISAMNSMMIT
jgi:flagellin